jgi:hypothetical protein
VANCLVRSQMTCPVGPPPSRARNVSVSEIPTVMVQSPPGRPSVGALKTAGYPSTVVSLKYLNRLRPRYVSDKPFLFPVRKLTPITLPCSESLLHHAQPGPECSAIALSVSDSPGLRTLNSANWVGVSTAQGRSRKLDTSNGSDTCGAPYVSSDVGASVVPALTGVPSLSDVHPDAITTIIKNAENVPCARIPTTGSLPTSTMNSGFTVHVGDGVISPRRLQLLHIASRVVLHRLAVFLCLLQ